MVFLPQHDEKIEVPRQGGQRDEHLPTACARAAERWLLLVHTRIDMLSRIMCIVEEVLAFCTDVVHLLVMLFKVLARTELLWCVSVDF